MGGWEGAWGGERLPKRSFGSGSKSLTASSRQASARAHRGMGRRDLWLHALACAEAWIAPDSDILARIADVASTATPGLSGHEVGRMMRPTARRAKRALRRAPGAPDPRYAYSGARLAMMLGVDADTAQALGLEQIVPETVRAERRRARRIRARRASGFLSRAAWLEANRLSREKPWAAEGVSRATWYRRRKAAAQRRVRARKATLLSGVAVLHTGVETGPVTLYGAKPRQAPTGSGRHAATISKEATTVDPPRPVEPRHIIPAVPP